MIATDLRASTRRIYRSMAVLAGLGLLASAFIGGWRTVAGFAVGAAFSASSFAVFHLVVHFLGANSNERPSQAAMALAGLRYIGLGAAAYAILGFSDGSIVAALAGSFLACAAVLIEALLELLSHWSAP